MRINGRTSCTAWEAVIFNALWCQLAGMFPWFRLWDRAGTFLSARHRDRQVKERERRRERRWNSKGKVTRKLNKGCKSSNKGNTILNTMERLYGITWLEMTFSQLLALNWLFKFASPSLEEFFNNLLSAVSSFLSVLLIKVTEASIWQHLQAP